MRYLASTARPHSVISCDAALSHPKYHDVLVLFAQYARSGGTAIYTDLFSAHVRFPESIDMFKIAWDLPWQTCSSNCEDSVIHRRAKRLDPGQLTESYYTKAVTISNVTPEDAV
ncbi:hypothetical protein BV20DRAFT_969917 [Pilatotrama ljubarskyi]|nr:hypothetical protein BV20DRAFT_969917 [Pilatotrama ljubarskyi]